MCAARIAVNEGVRVPDGWAETRNGSIENLLPIIDRCAPTQN